MKVGEHMHMLAYMYYIPTFIPNSITEKRMKPFIYNNMIGPGDHYVNEIIQDRNIDTTESWFHRHFPYYGDNPS